MTAEVTLCPPGPDHAEAVLQLLAARDVADFGDPGFTRDLLLDQWRVGDLDPTADTVVAEDRTRAVLGYGALFSPGALVFVDPGREGEGVGSQLLAWVEGRAHELGRPCHRQRIAARNASGRALLSAAGYSYVRSVWEMGRVLRTPISVLAVPEGIELRAVDQEADAAALHAADAAAFADNADYVAEGFTAFYEEHLASPEFDPAASRIAWRGGEIAGFVVCRQRDSGAGFVDLLGVDPSARGRGLGSLLLLSAFSAFAQAGRREAQLDVASDNPGALRLYERHGMTRRHRVDVFERPVT
jgi:mycothiol synthase